MAKRITLELSEPDAPKVTKFDRVVLRRLDDEFLAALEGVCAPLGLKVKAAGGRFSEFEFTAKFSITIDSNEAQQSKATGEKAEWERYAPIYGMKAEWFGREFKSRGQTYKIAGLMPRRPKFPVLAVRPDGKRMLFPADSIKMYFASN